MYLFLAVVCGVGLFFIHLIKSLVLCFVPKKFRTRKDITGQRILITGAGSGIGRQLAIQLSKYSTHLILLDINKESLLETEKLLDRRSTAFVYQCDVSNNKMVYEVAKRIKQEAGDVDILVNNAGIVVGKYLLDLPDEKIVKTMEVNTLAHFWMCKAFLPAMMAKNKGHIVNVASLMGKAGGPRLTDYCASKFAAIGFAEALEVELLEKKLDGIKVTIVCTSHVDTGLFDGAKLRIGGVMTPEYVAQEIVTGILEEQESIILPHFLKFVFSVAGFCPRWIRNWFQEQIGNLKWMENFKGRNTFVKSENIESFKSVQ